MSRTDQTNAPQGKQPTARDARLKAALKANLGRRKAQARARAAKDQVADNVSVDNPEEHS